jgi:NADH-quinone oxidoreductase subunit D
MNMAYIRPGGVPRTSRTAPSSHITHDRRGTPQAASTSSRCSCREPHLKGRTKGVGVPRPHRLYGAGHHRSGAALHRLPHDLRKSEPYCGYETYDFDVVTRTGADAYDRLMIRILEMFESLKIVEQCVERLRTTGGPVMVEDKKIAWPAQLSVGSDGRATASTTSSEIMGTSMEALIHHFKLVTEGFRVPPGQVYVAVESAKGELGCALGVRRRHAPLSGALPRPEFQQPAGRRRDVRGLDGRRRHRRRRQIDPVMGGVDR